MPAEISPKRSRRSQQPIVGRGDWSVIVKRGAEVVGEYRHETQEAAESDAARSRERFGVLGFRYEVSANAAISDTPGETSRKETK